ncbi:hypothetical protein VDIAB_100379 [Vibrio diabolicus]|nr:hypothetical protein VDIAB_100379 [Vibrio diabolicus]
MFIYSFGYQSCDAFYFKLNQKYYISNKKLIHLHKIDLDLIKHEML